MICSLKTIYKISNWVLLIITFPIDLLSQTKSQSLIASNDLVYYSIPPSSQDGIPVGNGKLGGLLVATQNGLSWQINHTDFWRYDAKTNVNRDDYGAAPAGLGRMAIQWKDTGATKKNMLIQRLSLYNALFSMNDKTSKISIENFFDMTQDCGIFKFKKTTGIPAIITVELSGWRAGISFFGTNSGVVITEPSDLSRSPMEIEYLKQLTSNKYVPKKSAQATGIQIKGSKIKNVVIDNIKCTLQFELKPGRDVILYIATTVKEEGEPLKNTVSLTKQLLELESKRSYATLKKAHDAWWRNFWNSSYVEIESKDSLAGFVENLWYLHLYEMAIADRGKYPIKFNGGNWITKNDDREWGGGYWQFNQQYAHMAMLAANHLEFLDNYYDPLVENLNLLKASSLDLWKHPGAFLHETHSPDGIAYQVNRNSIYSDSTKWTGLIFSSGAECIFQMYKYALYSGSENYMKTKVFPMMREVCLFYRYHLKKNNEGLYNLYPANMHENFWRVTNPQTDLAAIRACFPVLINMYEKFGGDLNEKREFIDILNNLAPFAKGKWLTNDFPDMGGHITNVDTSVDMFAPAILGTDSVIHNRHGMDSYTVYPFELTLPGKQGFNTALNTFNNRFYKPTRDILQHDMLPASLLGLPNESRNSMADYLSVCAIKSNGIVPESDIYSISLALNYMLLQSHDGIIQLFPACPENWDASFKLRAEGPMIVNASKVKNSVVECNILCLKKQHISVKNSWNAIAEVYVGKRLICSSAASVIQWNGEKGKNYSIMKKGTKDIKILELRERKINISVKTLGHHHLGLD